MSLWILKSLFEASRAEEIIQFCSIRFGEKDLGRCYDIIDKKRIEMFGDGH